MTSHNQPSNDADPLSTREMFGLSIVAKCGPTSVRFDPHARAYEAFNMTGMRTALCEPLAATTLADALAEATSRWAWDRGDRLGIREIGAARELGGNRDRLYVYAVRKKATGVRRDFTSVMEHTRWLDHICTIDLNVIAGIPVGLVGGERTIHAQDQARRPEGARLTR